MTQQITPQDTQKVLDLCSGIGGFTLGHKICGGFETVAFCEINSYCQQILNLRFPHIPIISDIHDITVESLCRVRVREIDGIIAGLPCPPLQPCRKTASIKRLAQSVRRVFRILRQVQPQWAIVENVPGLLTAEGSEFFRAVLWQFTSLGFDVQWGIVSASQVGAVHLRERVWIIAHSQSPRRGTSWYKYTQTGANAASVGCDNHCNFQRASQTYNSVEYKARAIAQRTSSGGDDGLSARLDRCLLGVTGITDWLCASTIPSFNRLTRREVAALTSNELAEYRQLYAEYQAIRKQHKQQLMALGNAIVPQCAALIFERLKRILSQQQKNS